MPLSLEFEYLDPQAMLADPRFRVVEAFLEHTRRQRIGWHYAIDLAWIHLQTAHWPRGARVLDAGGGNGPAQFLLAELGFDVTNIDLARRRPPRHLVGRYGLSVVELPSYAPTSYVEHQARGGDAYVPGPLDAFKLGPVGQYLIGLRYAWRHRRWRQAAGLPAVAPGRLTWCVGNLCAMPEMADDSFDAVVSLSALEHIPGEAVATAVAEIDRVVRPGGPWAVTTSATERAQSWWHEASAGWCFAAADLERLFGARSAAGNADAGTVLAHYRQCDYLRERLADFYFTSGNNGMPWGEWNPTYVPVGIRRATAA
ncbi:MAG: class I SAM-dependent methyltransferase [Gammaproteobacteria bacterium]